MTIADLILEKKSNLPFNMMESAKRAVYPYLERKQKFFLTFFALQGYEVEKRKPENGKEYLLVKIATGERTFLSVRINGSSELLEELCKFGGGMFRGEILEKYLSKGKYVNTVSMTVERAGLHRPQSILLVHKGDSKRGDGITPNPPNQGGYIQLIAG